VDRPFLQHVIEFCVYQGVRRFDFVLSHLPEKVEAFLGGGERWGSAFTYHLAREPSRPYRLLRVLDFADGPDEPVLFGHADRLPQFQLAEVKAAGVLPLLFGWRDAEAAEPDCRRWTGWALLSPRGLASLPADPDEAELEAHLRAAAAGERSWCEVGRPLSMVTFADILASHHAVLTEAFRGLLLSGRQADPGVWLSRNVKLHPTVQLVPPVYIGENCGIDAAARLGPDAVIGKDCLLDDHCTVANSVIFPGNYIGQALVLEDVIVDERLLINARLGVAVPVADDRLLAPVSTGQVRKLTSRTLARLAALALLLLTSPILLLTALCLRLFRRGPVCHRKEVVRLPALPAERSWRAFKLLSFSMDRPPGKAPSPGIPSGLRSLLLRFLPALVNVVKGELAFVGVPPRTRAEIRQLPPDWQALYLRAKAGLVTEAAVRAGASADEHEIYAAEAFYVGLAGWKYDLKLLLRFLARCLLPFGRRGAD
jgi:lipopolysaccharide/colanic/teichoic acid biosynthesis glycosyltransferase